MGLEFKNNLEAIRFGDIVAQPSVNIEQRLRLQNLKLSDGAEIDEAITVMSECFGSKAEKVSDYIRNNMTLIEIVQLQAYLVGGQRMLDKINKNMEQSDGE